MPVITARYAGKCACGAKVAAGSPITYENRAVAACVTCDPTLGSVAVVGAGAAPAPRVQAARAPIPAYTDAARAALLGRLDADQRVVAAWQPDAGNLRVIAAAGSGKTTTVTALVGNLLTGSHVTPSDLIVTTFTRKAADELVERLHKVVPHTLLRDVRVGTFHSLALKVMRQLDATRWALPRCTDASRRLRAQDVLSSDLLWANALGMGNIRTVGRPGIDIAEDSRREYVAAVEVIRSRNIRFGTEAARQACAATGHPFLYTGWELYDLQKRNTQAYDFGDLLDAYLDVTLQHPAGGATVIVDEAQDNDVRQALLARALAGTTGKVILVGDVRQSIYEWRGGAPDLFANADRDLSARTLYLPRNYRSGESIVTLGNRVAEGRSWSIGPAAVVGDPERQGKGTVAVRGYGDASMTCDAVAADIAAAVRDGAKPSDFAVLCRTRAQQGPYEVALLTASIPVAIVGGQSYFASKGWQDFAALLGVVTNTADEKSITRAVMREQGCGWFAGRDVAAAFRESRDSLVALHRAAETTRNDRTRAPLVALAIWAADVRKSPDFATVCDRVSERLCAQASAASDDGDDDVRGIYEVAARLAAPRGSARGAFDFAARCEGAVVDADDAEAAAGRVCISTLHKAKGREWPAVYLDATAGLFPHVRCEGDDRRMEEEARLFYVGVTRAERTLTLTYADHDHRGNSAGASEFLTFADAPVQPLPPATEPAPVATLADVVAAPAESRDSTSGLTVDAMRAAMTLLDPVAERLTRNAAKPAPGQRFVPVSLADFDALLGQHGFMLDDVAERRTGQRVLAATLASGERVLVYTSVPAGESIARGLGEDSIKVALLSPEGRPMMKRQPYAARTVNWRRTLLARIDTALATLA